MLETPPIWFLALAFLGAIGPLVFIHEFGHYIVGRWFGIGAETFSIGFGREVAGWTDKRGTRWKVGWLPLGGYVRFTGDMNPASMGQDLDKLSPDLRARSFHAKPVWQRALVVFAGPAANFLLAILIFAAFIAVNGAPRTPAVVAAVMPGSPAAAIGLVKGDRVVGIDGREIRRFDDLADYSRLRPGEEVVITVERAGRSFTASTRLASVTEADRFGQTYRVGRLGIATGERVFEPVPPLQLIPEAAGITWSTIENTSVGLWQIITGRRPLEELGGPIKMAQVAGQVASIGWFEFVQLIAFFSINLGFINLLPVPMLDGGHLALYAVEATRRKPLGAQAQEWLFRGGFAALMTLMLVATLNDLSSVGLWQTLGRLLG
ncbi:regulator of sigma E protease [Sphingomonas kaistensis]|uniref:Regulator of sigma E protease n=1 Tax=Sphingomonas kaistensis TaxID=298708 RepID=A0A7X5Y851_9SPHN|nr:M50 family metallopeptidase [Sphingomonas kaistensis]NJC06287.1 regulator of sigma E protease [Sphingomonas kaistensis]